MTIDVVDLREFYSRRLGIVARQMINRGIRERWPRVDGQRVLGFGYPTPYLGLFREDAERCIAFMPSAQGVLKWPTGRPALASLVDEFSLPLPDAAVDRILLVHALEMSDDPAALLREAWRVLSPSGRVIAVIPNRRGVWTRTDSTPFGHGRPYSRSQITDLLRQTWFTPDRLGRGAVHAALCRGLGAEIRTDVGAGRRGAVAALRRRAHRRGDQAGLPRDPRQARAGAAHSITGEAGAGTILDDGDARLKTNRPGHAGTIRVRTSGARCPAKGLLAGSHFVA
ncbi:SAM-dependent methyltransferase [Bradyrhizobium sp. GM2.4]